MDPVDDLETELRRVALRWQQLRADVAARHLPAAQALCQRLAGAQAGQDGWPAAGVPNLGAAAVIDQLRVTARGAVPALGESAVAAQVADLRRHLA